MICHERGAGPVWAVSSQGVNFRRADERETPDARSAPGGARRVGWPAGTLTPMQILILGVVLAAIAQPAPPDPESIGSLRNAKVAHPVAEGERLTYISPELTDEQRAELREVAPNVTVLEAASDEEALAHAPEADGVDGRFLSPEFLERTDHLTWVQCPSAGVNWILDIGTLRTDDRIVLTNMRAVHGPAIADHAFAMLLTLTRSMRSWEQHRESREWSWRADPEPIALQGRTMFVVGLGGIGSEIAQRAKGFGMRVIASRRSDTPKPDYVDMQGTPAQLLEMLCEADVVAICLPLTDQTAGLFDARAFEAMKPGAFLINVARGQIVDTDAMLAALHSGHLAGACLDVTDPEPLPPDHPLWTAPNVVITPHVASIAGLTSARRWALTRENIRRFGAGEPLLNTVDKQAGY